MDNIAALQKTLQIRLRDLEYTLMQYQHCDPESWQGGWRDRAHNELKFLNEIISNLGTIKVNSENK